MQNIKASLASHEQYRSPQFYRWLSDLAGAIRTRFSCSIVARLCVAIIQLVRSSIAQDNAPPHCLVRHAHESVSASSSDQYSTVIIWQFGCIRAVGASHLVTVDAVVAYYGTRSLIVRRLQDARFEQGRTKNSVDLSAHWSDEYSTTVGIETIAFLSQLRKRGTIKDLVP